MGDALTAACLIFSLLAMAAIICDWIERASK